MIDMEEIRLIKDLYENKEQSLRDIVKITGHCFQTVQKFAYMDNWSPSNQPVIKVEKYPILGNYIETIDEWLEQDTKEPRKQRHTVTKIWKRLQDEKSFTGGYSSVKKYVRKKKYLMNQAKEGFLPLAQPAAHAQIDFGDFKYYDEHDVGREGHALIVSFPHSNAGFMQVFPSENQECLLEGMKRIFNYIGGTPIRIKADNMTTAVAHVLKGTERILTDGFSRFMLHYRFGADFCNPAKGNEKGNVENKVGYDRRNMLVPVPRITDFEEFNKGLLIQCDDDHNRLHYKHKVPICELWEQERKHLLTLPQYDFDVFRYETLRVSNQGFVVVDTNNYGISPELYGKLVQVKIYFDKVEFYYDHNLLKTYARSYKRGDEVIDWKQYLPTLLQKPGATPHTRFFNQLPKLWQEHLKNTQGKERKTALMVLLEIIRDGNDELCDEALSMAFECGRNDADSIRQCYYMISKTEHHPKPLTILDAPTINYNPNLDVYDGLIGGDKNVRAN